MTVIDETKPLNRLLLEDDHDDLEFHPPRTRRDGAGAWKRKQQNFRFNEAFGPEPVMDRIRESWTRGKLLEEGGDALFKTRAGVGRDQVNGQIDMAKVESLLEQAGVIDLTGYKGPTGLFSYDKEDAIKDFQPGNGLRVDGAIKPNGETMRALKAQLGPKLNAPVKIAPLEMPEPGRVQLAANTSDGAVINDAYAGLLGKTVTKFDTEMPEVPGGQRTEPQKFALLETPDISTTPGKTSSAQGFKPYLDAAEVRFDRYEEIFAKNKLIDAARFLKHFRSGSGAEIKFTREQARNFEPIRSAERNNRFLLQSRTFRAQSGEKKVNKALKSLVDGGKPVTIVDWYDYDQGPGRSLITTLSSGSDFYFSKGRTKIRSTVKLEAWRVGDVIYYKGFLTNDWNDIYDFDLLQPGGLGARALQKYRGAKPFKFGATWQQKFSGTVHLSYGAFLIPKIEWRDVQ